MHPREDYQSFGWTFWLVAWGIVGVMIFAGGSDIRSSSCSIIWVMITAWISVVAIYEKFFGEVAIGRRKARLTVRRLCVECGYDLRATDNRCPECGHELAASRERVQALQDLVGTPVARRFEIFVYEQPTDTGGDDSLAPEEDLGNPTSDEGNETNDEARSREQPL